MLYKLVMKRFLLLVLFSSLACISLAEDTNPSLIFLVSGKQVDELTLDKLKAELPVSNIEFFDPMYGETKRYEGFPVVDVLRLGFGEDMDDAAYTDIAFTALDGYVGVSSAAKMKEKGGYIVFSDRDHEDWEPIGRQKANPGPFYLVWTG